jgi:hypothetical protein
MLISLMIIQTQIDKAGKKHMPFLFKKSSIALLCMLMLSLCFLSAQQATAQTDQTASKLQAADTAVNQAFNAILGAEKSGANITQILTQLNVAYGLLDQAENAYRTGDSNTAASQADLVIPIAQEVTQAAQKAKQGATIFSQDAFWSLIAFTVIGVAVFLTALLVFWRWLKRRYIKGLSTAKPEVIDQ